MTAGSASLPLECSSLLKRQPQSSLLAPSHRVTKPSDVVERDQNLDGQYSESERQHRDDEPNPTTTTLIVFDTNDDEEDENGHEIEEDYGLNAPMFQRHVSRPLFGEEGEEDLLAVGDENDVFSNNDQSEEEEEEEIELDVELEYSPEEFESPMEDVNMKIDRHILAQASELNEEDIDVVGDEGGRQQAGHDTRPALLSPIGSHLRSGGMRSIPSTTFLHDIGRESTVKEELSDRSSVKSVFSASSSSSNFFSYSTRTTISYQYESNDEPLEYKVHDREEEVEEEEGSQQHYRHQNHEDYGFLDFSRSHSSPVIHNNPGLLPPSSNNHFNTTNNTSSSSSSSYYSSYQDNEEEFQRQQRRHFSGRLYERCNFSRFQTGDHNNNNQGGRVKARSNELVRHSPSLLHFNGMSGASRSLSSSWRRRQEQEEGAIEEGMDVAAELDAPPLPLRSSSDWLRRQFSNRLPNIQSIMATPLSPPFSKHMNIVGREEREQVQHSKQQDLIIVANSNNVPSKSEPITIDAEEEEDEEEMVLPEEESTSPPKMFYCSPPSSPPPSQERPSNRLIVFDFPQEKPVKNVEEAEIEKEEGFFEEVDEDEEEDTCHPSSDKHLRKRKTTGNGAGKLAVLEKRPCCNEEEQEVAVEESKDKESDADSGVDVNGALSTDDSSSNGEDEDQTVPVASLMLSTPMVFM